MHCLELIQFGTKTEVSAPKILIDLSEEIIPIAIDNGTEEKITNYTNTTLRLCKTVQKILINHSTNMPKLQEVPTKNNKHEMNTWKNSVDKDIRKRFHDQFESLVKEITKRFFSESELDISKCVVTKQRIDIQLGSG